MPKVQYFLMKKINFEIRQIKIRFYPALTTLTGITNLSLIKVKNLCAVQYAFVRFKIAIRKN